MNLTKRANCHTAMDSRWAMLSGIMMGISVFSRIVYYFGLTNLNDLGAMKLVTHVVLPMIVAACFLVVVKVLHRNSPLIIGCAMAACAVSYLLVMDMTATGMVGAFLMILTVALFIVTGMGYVPMRLPLLVMGLAMALYRLLTTDLLVNILPLSKFDPIAYLPEMSNLFSFLAIAAICPVLRLDLIKTSVPEET